MTPLTGRAMNFEAFFSGQDRRVMFDAVRGARMYFFLLLIRYIDFFRGSMVVLFFTL